MTILSSRKVKIRKPCHCAGCDLWYLPGTIMQKTAAKMDGDFQTWAYCPTCDEYWSRYMGNEDEISIGDLRYEDSESWEELERELRKMS